MQIIIHSGNLNSAIINDEHRGAVKISRDTTFKHSDHFKF